MGSQHWWHKETGKFQAWVEKHQIGPGMNDAQFRPNRTLYSGFDGTVGDGWLPILDRLATDLIAMGWDRDLHQVKEKFGGLRFYIGASTKEMEDRIDQAEREASKTCENCGAPGKTQGPGWLLTLCDTCQSARLKAKEERDRAQDDQG